MIKCKAGIGITQLPMAGQLLSAKLLQGTRNPKDFGHLFLRSKQSSPLTVLPVLSSVSFAPMEAELLRVSQTALEV